MRDSHNKDTGIRTQSFLFVFLAGGMGVGTGVTTPIKVGNSFGKCIPPIKKKSDRLLQASVLYFHYLSWLSI